MHQRERTGGEIAWEELCWEGAALKMRSCLHGFYIEQLLHRGALHRGTLHGGSFTQRSLYTGRALQTESFTQRSFYTGKVFVKTMHISTLFSSLYHGAKIQLDRSLCGCQHSFPVEKAHVRSVRCGSAWGIQLAPELWWKSRDLWTGGGQSLLVTWKRSLRSR